MDYDYDGQCTSTTQGGNTTSFATDALGRRVCRTAGGTTTNFQYAGDAVLLEKQGASTTGTYTYGNALIRKDGETPLYDGLGTARAETSSAQAVTFTQTPDAFGNTVATTGSTGSSYQFAATSGYRSDGDAGLMKVGARYYDPQTGSFITRDTYLDQKPYLYCEHDPVNAVDPSGHAGTHGNGLSVDGEMFPGAHKASAYVSRMLKNGVDGAIVGAIIGGGLTGPFGGEGGPPMVAGGFLTGSIGTPIADVVHWIEKKIGM